MVWVQDTPAVPKLDAIRVYGEALRPDMPYTSVFVAPVTTCEEVVALVMHKYQYPGEPTPWALFRERDRYGTRLRRQRHGSAAPEPRPPSARGGSDAPLCRPAAEELNPSEPLNKVIAGWANAEEPSRLTVRRRQEKLVRRPPARPTAPRAA